MGHWEELVPSQWMRAVDFHGDWTGVIAKISIESLVSLDVSPKPEERGGAKKNKGVVWFEGVDKGWVLNRTNAQLIAAILGDDPSTWIGHALTLYSAKVRGADGQPTQGIRVKGSPEITKPVDAEIKLPRRKPTKYRLVPTGQQAAAATGAQ